MEFVEQLGGGEMNELLSTKTCSPLVIYLVVLVVSGLSVYLTKMSLNKHGTYKMNNLFSLYSLQELKFAIVVGVIMYGLCQYNKDTLAWVFLIFPIIYIIIQNIVVHIHVSSAVQNAPEELELTMKESYSNGPLSGMGVIPQDTKQTPITIGAPPTPMVPSMKQTPDMPPVQTQSSQLLGGSNLMNNAQGMMGDSMGGVQASGGAGNFSMF